MEPICIGGNLFEQVIIGGILVGIIVGWAFIFIEAFLSSCEPIV